jgi:SNF2 family DNA or RNA helicase
MDELSTVDEVVERFSKVSTTIGWLDSWTTDSTQVEYPMASYAHALLLIAEKLLLSRSFEELRCWGHVKIERFAHQVETALRVLNEMNCCAVLADDVGLGKTIEAGLVMKELIMRGLVKSVLILVPASLIWQWYHEMLEKFGERFTVAHKVSDWLSGDKIIGSIDLAKREPHSSQIVGREFDLLIIDEAHKLKNRATLAYRFCQKIKKRYMLLLTATPVQNDLLELYNLVTLVKPGLLGTVQSFKRRYVSKDDLRKPKNVNELRHLLSAVMIRHNRDEVGVTLPPRYATTHLISLSQPEMKLYEELTAFLRQSYKQLKGSSGKERFLRSMLVLLQKELCSTPRAVAKTLLKLSKDAYPDETRQRMREFYELANSIPMSAKVEETARIVSACDEKVLIFTDYIASMELLKETLEGNGQEVVVYHGGMNDKAKDIAVNRFRDEAKVMISTESGAEGRNLQFCRVLINFDLPWNPMRLEQRIGRIHRLGQDKPVFIVNLATESTVEERILDLLITKIGLFEMVVGELELMLGISHLEESIERMITEAIMQSETPQEEEERLNQISRLLQRATERYTRVKKANEMLQQLVGVEASK